jgi:hypothetical protein
MPRTKGWHKHIPTLTSTPSGLWFIHGEGDCCKHETRVKERKSCPHRKHQEYIKIQFTMKGFGRPVFGSAPFMDMPLRMSLMGEGA